MKEVWKPIENYESLYKISNFGRVKSLVGWNGKKYIKREKILKPSVVYTTNNYSRYQLNLIKNQKSKSFRIHRLVAIAFVPNSKNKKEINHIDSNPLNNKASNLEWVTHSENMKHASKYGNRKPKKYEHELIKDYLNNKLLVSEIQLKYNINNGKMWNILAKHNVDTSKRKLNGRKYKINLKELLQDFKNGLKNKELKQKYNCSSDIIATRKYQFKRRKLL